MTIQIDHLTDVFDDALELIEDEQQRERTRRVIAASRAALERRAHDVVVAVLDEANASLAGQRAVLRYREGGLSVEVTSVEDALDDEQAWADATADKLTLRIPAPLRVAAAAAAAAEGLSLNSWLVRAVARMVRHHGGVEHGPRRGRRGRWGDKARGAPDA